MDAHKPATGMSHSNTRALGWARLGLSLAVFVILLRPGAATYGAAPGRQSDATITIGNESDEPICVVYISPVGSSTWGDNWVDRTEPILSQTQWAFHVAPSSYDILLVGCERNFLLRADGVAVSESHKITLTQNDVCVANYDSGHNFYQEYKYEDSLQYFQKALTCYRGLGDKVAEANTLYYIGVVYEDQGLYEMALLQFETALAIARKIGERSTEMKSLSNIGHIRQDAGDYLAAIASYEAALTIAREIGDRQIEGNSLYNIGSAYLEQGRLDDALAQFEAALVIIREAGTHLMEGRTLNNIGAVYKQQGHLEEAVTYYEQALAIAREADDRSGQARTLNNLGALYRDEQRYEEALLQYEAALEISREIGDRPNVAIVIHNIGGIYAAQGRYEDALERYEAALAIKRELGMDSEVTLNSKGSVYVSQGRYEAALLQYEEALSIAREVGNRRAECSALYNIGFVYYRLGHYEEALRQYETVASLARENGYRDIEGKALGGMGVIYSAQGRLEEAQIKYQASLEKARELSDREAEMAMLTNIGRLHYKKGLYEAALAHYEEALAIAHEIADLEGEMEARYAMGALFDLAGRLEEALVQYETGLTIALEIGSRAYESNLRYGLGGVYLRQERYETALSHYEAALAIEREIGDVAGEATVLSHIGLLYQLQDHSHEASAMYEAAMPLVESLRTTAGNEQARTGFVAQYDYLYFQAIDLYLNSGQAAEAFFTSERARARSFLDSLATGYIQPDDSEMAQLIEREQEAYQRRQAIADALARARGQATVDDGLVADLEADLAAAQADYETVLDEIAARQDILSSLIPGRGLDYVLDVTELQNLLPVDTTLISYFLYPGPEDEEYAVAFVLTKEGFKAVELSVGEEQLADQLTLSREIDLANPHPDSLRQLYAWLVAPFEAQLQTSRLIIVPHGVLHYVPFAALTDGERYLGERFVIANLPSASVLPLLQESKSERGTPLVLGNPFGSVDMVGLPAAEAEAEAIAALYGDTAYIGTEATESTVHAQAGHYGILHIASHAILNAAAPLQSALNLAADGTNDGLLHVDEVYGLNLADTDLVVLSACETTVGEDSPGDVSPGDDIVALNRAFLFAGAPTVIASLWNVNDQATSILMTSFYTYLKEGWGEAEALRQAQIDLRAQHSQFTHPYFWAGFVLNGDGGEMTHPIDIAQQVIDQSDVSTPPVQPPSTATPATPEPEARPRLGLCSGAALPLAMALVVMRRKRHLPR